MSLLGAAHCSHLLINTRPAAVIYEPRALASLLTHSVPVFQQVGGISLKFPPPLSAGVFPPLLTVSCSLF